MSSIRTLSLVQLQSVIAKAIEAETGKPLEVAIKSIEFNQENWMTEAGEVTFSFKLSSPAFDDFVGGCDSNADSSVAS